MRKHTPSAVYWKALPFIRLVLPLMLGIFLAEKIAIQHFSLKIVLLFSFLSLFYFKQGLKDYANRWIAAIPINLFLLLLGYQLTFTQNELHHPLHFQDQIQTENYIIGIITNLPTIKKDKIKVELTTQTIGTDKQTLTPCNGNLLLYLKNYEGAPSLNYGDQLLLKSIIHPIQKANNPNAFDYAEYLYFQNIHFQFFSCTKDWK